MARLNTNQKRRKRRNRRRERDKRWLVRTTKFESAVVTNMRRFKKLYGDFEESESVVIAAARAFFEDKNVEVVRTIDGL